MTFPSDRTEGPHRRPRGRTWAPQAQGAQQTGKPSAAERVKPQMSHGDRQGSLVTMAIDSQLHREGGPAGGAAGRRPQAQSAPRLSCPVRGDLGPPAPTCSAGRSALGHNSESRRPHRTAGSRWGRKQTLDSGVRARAKPAPRLWTGVAGEAPGGLGISGVPHPVSPKGLPRPARHRPVGNVTRCVRGHRPGPTGVRQPPRGGQTALPSFSTALRCPRPVLSGRTRSPLPTKIGLR